MNEEHPTRFRWCRSAQTKKKRKFSGRMRSRKDFENLINALRLLANQQRDGDSPLQSIVMGLKEKCRERITNGLRSCIASDNYSALVVGHLRRGLYHHYREMSKAAGAKKPSESQKAKALWAVKAAKDTGDEFCDPACKENIVGRNQTRLELREEHLKDPNWTKL